MSASLQRLFRLAPGEGVKVLQFAGVGLLLQAGLALGVSAADSLFLSRVGADKLPHIYILTPVMMLLYIPAFSMLLGRYGIDRVFDCTLAVLAAGGVVFWFALSHHAAALPLWLCYAAKLYAGLWYVGLYTLFWNFIDGYFDLIDAKRLYALFAAGCATGAMLGGGLVSHFAEIVGVERLFLGWSIFAIACWPLVRRTRQNWRKLEVEAAGDEDGGTAAARAISGLASLRRSRFAAALTIGLFLTLITATMCDYQYMGVFSAGRDEAALAALFGRLTATVNVLNLLLTLFFFNALVGRFGVRNVALIQPLAYGLVFVWLLAQHGLPAAVAGFFAYHGLMTAIDFNNVNLLFAGLPADSRKEIRTFIEGLCEPCATAAAGFFLLLVAPRLSTGQLSLAGAVAALGSLGFVLVVRHDYAGAITANLRRDWLDLSRRPAWWPAPPPLTDTNASMPAGALLAALPKMQGTRREAVLVSLAQRGEPDIAAPLLLAAGDFSPAERRQTERLLVELGPAVVPALVEAAESPRYSVRARSIALRALGKLDFPRLRAVAAPLMDRTVRRAYGFLGGHAVLAGHGRDPGQAVLARIYRDYPALALEVVLEALTISGQLPPYEAIAVALHSGRSKERGFAIETIEQGAGRKLSALLAPWLDGRTVDAQIAYGRSRGFVPALTEREVLARALDSAFPLECAAAWQSLWEAGEREPLAARLRALPHPLLTETARVLEARAGGATTEPTPVERVHALMAAPEFAIFEFTQLEWLVLRTRVESPGAGAVLAEAGGRLAQTWLVLAGEISGARTYRAGEVAGAAALHGERTADETLTAGAGLRVLVVPAAAVLECGETFPALGLELLRRRAAA